ncbi:MAG: prephenate dehydratase [Chloroflexi bacterium]|jgi:prephenate dehydratase|nr:prephenate dehydratase [Chloroflexota bacterium]
MNSGLRIAFQGEAGAYSEEAALALYPGAQPCPCESFDAVFAGVESGLYDQGVVPVENSLAGSIHRNYDLLLQHKLYIIAEHTLRISHCLIAHPGVSLSEITQVYSHPQGLAQCEQSLARLGEVQRIAAHDTAGSVRLVRDEGWRHAAAIASKHAAQIYGMQVLIEQFEDDKSNYTRFIAIAREPVQPTGEAKTAIAFAGINQPGLLFRCLSAFALRDIDLCKIESRPMRGVPWEYIFFVEFAGSISEERCRRALGHLEEMATFVRVLGSFPRARPTENGQ